MDLDIIENIFEENKLKNFESQSGLEGIDKANVINRINKRLRTALEVGKLKNNDDAKEFVEKQIVKLDVPKKKKPKANKTGMFKYEWAEDIYKEYAFLGAEINKMKQHSEFNKKLIKKIHFFEKKGKKPSEKEIDKTIAILNSSMDKKDLNDSELLRRKSIEKILDAVISSETETMEFSHKDEETGEEEQRTLIFLMLDASMLSFNETRALKKLFDFEEDPTNNMLLIEGGVVKTVEADPTLIYYEDIARSNIIEIIVDNIHSEGFVYQRTDVAKFINKAKENSEETKAELNRQYNRERDNPESDKFHNKSFFINGVIVLISILIVLILANKLFNIFP